MGEHEGWTEPPSGLLLNGLLPNEAASAIRVIDSERWSKAEERITELIDCIKPNPISEERRSAVASYVEGLIVKCFPCKVGLFLLINSYCIVVKKFSLFLICNLM